MTKILLPDVSLHKVRKLIISSDRIFRLLRACRTEYIEPTEPIHYIRTSGRGPEKTLWYSISTNCYLHKRKMQGWQNTLNLGSLPIQHLRGRIANVGYWVREAPVVLQMLPEWIRNVLKCTNQVIYLVRSYGLHCIWCTDSWQVHDRVVLQLRL